LIIEESSVLCEAALPLFVARPGTPDDTEETPEGVLVPDDARPMETSLLFKARGEEEEVVVTEEPTLLLHTT
jgi:hypothetical protein